MCERLAAREAKLSVEREVCVINSVVCDSVAESQEGDENRRRERDLRGTRRVWFGLVIAS